MKTRLEIPGRHGIFPGMDVMCTRLTGYFLTAGVFIVVEACLGLQTALANARTTFAARARARGGRDEATSSAARSAASTSLSGEFQQLSNTIYQRVSSLTWVLIQISRPPCIHSKFRPTPASEIRVVTEKYILPRARSVKSFASNRASI